MVGQRDSGSIQRPLERLARNGIDVRFGEVQRIEPDIRRVTISGDALEADYLVIALGAELNPKAIPGLEQAGHNFYTPPGAKAFWSSLRSFRSRIIVLTASPAYKCPAAPCEAAMLIEAFCRKRGIRDARAHRRLRRGSGTHGRRGSGRLKWGSSNCWPHGTSPIILSIRSRASIRQRSS
jgi:sulfide:quinone oxidoreductase